MSRAPLSTNAPLSATGSAAQPAHTDEDNSGAFIRPAEADRVRPRLRMVAGGAPVVGPVVGDDDYPNTVRASAPHGEVLAKDWAEDWPEDFLAVVESGDGGSKAQSAIRNPRNAEHAEIAEHAEKPPQSAIRNPQSAIRRPGLKKLNKKQIAMDWPPTPRGCEWRRSDDGSNLWRCWTEWDDGKGKRIKKSRYAGHLSDDAWRIMKEYDHEAFISIVGERLRRHSGR
jgi:hypothetical protein